MNAWEKQAGWWHAAFGGALLLVAGLALAAGAAPLRLAMLVALEAAFATWYLLAGRSAFRCRAEDHLRAREARLYLAGAAAAFAAMLVVFPGSALLLYLGLPVRMWVLTWI